MKHGIMALCAAVCLTVGACGGDGGGGEALVQNTPVQNTPLPNTPDENDNTATPTATRVPGDSPAVCDPCTVDTLSEGFGICLNACRVDCPEPFSECREACLDECDGCGTGMACLTNRDVRMSRCGPTSELTTCDGVEYGGPA